MAAARGGASPDPAGRFDSTSALVRAEADYVDATLHALAARLGSVPGLNLSVTHRQGKLRRLVGDLPYVNDMNRRTEPIEQITVVVGPYAYWLRSQQGTITCGRDPVPPGQGNQELTFSAWANALLEDIAGHNLVNHDSLVALRQLVERDRVG